MLAKSCPPRIPLVLKTEDHKAFGGLAQIPPGARPYGTAAFETGFANAGGQVSGVACSQSAKVRGARPNFWRARSHLSSGPWCCTGVPEGGVVSADWIGE